LNRDPEIDLSSDESSPLIPPRFKPRCAPDGFTRITAFRGNKIVEVKPVWANKGDAFERLLAAQKHPDFLFAAGDDRTDEELFELIQNGVFTLHVGPGSTRAAFAVPDFRSVRDLLEMLVEARPVSVGASSTG